MKLLIENLARRNILKSKSIIEAFRHIDRKDFVPLSHQKEAYGDYPLPIGYGQTISQPFTVAFMLELLQPQKDEKILDIGSGSGWTTALLADIVGPGGQVIGLEIIPELVTLGKNNLTKYNLPQAKILAAGRNFGYKKEAPYNRILVSASSRQLPRPLLKQLKIGGVIVIPVNYSIFKIFKKSEKEFQQQKFTGFAFVPLV